MTADNPSLVNLSVDIKEISTDKKVDEKINNDVERKSISTYKKIYVGVDSSPLSDEAINLSLEIGKAFNSELIGSHVYAAKLHDQRFRSMEGGLPEQYQEEKELNKQRKIHDSLITKGLELITDSYLEQMNKQCLESKLKFTGVSLEGRNWRELTKDIESNDYDLVALGAHGIGRVSLSQIGTVVERVMRRIKKDLLIVKKKAEENTSDVIVICLDGSKKSWGCLERAIQLATKLDKKIKAISAFDPYFHYAMFNSLNKTLNDKARKVFKFEEQEKLHEDIIDSGLAKIYQSHLNIAKKMAAKINIEIETQLLDGKAFEKILDYVEKENPWLVIMGRTGYHSDDNMDIGGNTENVIRLTQSNVLMVDFESTAAVEDQAEETVTWTVEAKDKMKMVPDMAKGVAMSSIQNYCIAEGYTVVTGSLFNEAVKSILPPEAMAKMGINFEEEEIHDLDKIALSYKCQSCGHVHHGNRPGKCPICGQDGKVFQIIKSETVEDGEVLETLGNRQLIWEKSALKILNNQSELIKNQIKIRLEKKALTQRKNSITLGMLEFELNKEENKFTSKNDQTEEIEISPLKWTDEGIHRLERVPEGFMRKAAKSTIENYAQENKVDVIDREVVEKGLVKAREKMAAAMGKRVS